MLTKTQAEVLEIIKLRPISTEEIMDLYNLNRLGVRLMIKSLRRKTETPILNEKTIVYKHKKCEGYSTNGTNLMLSRLKSTLDTCIKNNPQNILYIYKVLNEYKQNYKGEL